MTIKCQANRVELNEWQRKRGGGQERQRESKGQSQTNRQGGIPTRKQRYRASLRKKRV